MSNKKKIVLVVVIILLSIGFASVAVNLRINGNVMVKGNASNFDVIYDTTYYDGKGIAVVNGLQYTVDNPSYTNNTSMTFNPSKGLLKVGDYYEVSYKILNNSTLYGALVNIQCGSNSDGTGDLSPFTYSGDTYNIKISPQGNKEGKIRFTYSTEQETNTNLSFTCKVVAEALSTDINKNIVGTNIYSLVKGQYVGDTLNNTLDFKINSGASGTNGVYKTTETDSGNDVYYFRGSYSSLKNNIIFNNMCWKIVRTTETNGVKLIYNGIPSNGECTTQTGTSTQIGIIKFNQDNSPAYAGYMYGTPYSHSYASVHANINDSTIKSTVDTWFKENFSEQIVSAYLEDTVFCNDRSFSSGDGYYGTSDFSSKYRSSPFATDPAPSLKCTNDNDKFTVSDSLGNGALTYPVGIITSDELVFAGFNPPDSNRSNYTDTTNYLYTNQTYWTISPVGFSPSGGVFTTVLYYSGLMTTDQVFQERGGARPMISLNGSTSVKASGDGSTTNPYIVQ